MEMVCIAIVNWGQAWSEGVKRWGDNLFGSFSGRSI